jgi:hypothetical protein
MSAPGLLAHVPTTRPPQPASSPPSSVASAAFSKKPLAIANAPTSPTSLVAERSASGIAATAPVDSAARSARIGMTGDRAAARPDTALIDATLDRYRAAYGRLDADATRAVWPSVDVRALARAFGGLREQEVHFDRCAVDVAGADATATCGGRAIYVTRVGSQDRRSEPRRWRFRLKKTGGGWTIANVSAMP